MRGGPSEKLNGSLQASIKDLYGAFIISFKQKAALYSYFRRRARKHEHSMSNKESLSKNHTLSSRTFSAPKNLVKLSKILRNYRYTVSNSVVC